MKKTARIFAALMTIILSCCMFVTPAFAATSSPLKQRSTEYTNALVNAGAYYGWNSEQNAVSETARKIVTSIKLKNSKWSMTVTQTTAMSSGRISNSYAIGGTTYSLTNIKKTLKKYAVGTDKRNALKDQAAIYATKLSEYATKRGWKTSFKSSYKNKKAKQVVTFENGKYRFNATVTCFRKSGKIAVSYLRQGKTSTAKAIKNWLAKYKQ